MQLYVFVSTIVFMSAGILWSKDNAVNAIMKLGLVFMGVVGLLLTLDKLP